MARAPSETIPPRRRRRKLVASGLATVAACSGCATFLSDPFVLENQQVAPNLVSNGGAGSTTGSTTGSANTAGTAPVTMNGQAGSPASMPSAAPIDDGEVPFEEPEQPDAGGTDTQPSEGGAGGAGGADGAGGAGGGAAAGAGGCSGAADTSGAGACTEIEFVLTPTESSGFYGDDADLTLTVDGDIASSIGAQSPDAWIEYELDEPSILTRSQVATGIDDAGESPTWQLLYFDGTDFVEAVAATTGVDAGYSDSDVEGFVTDRVRFVFNVLDSGGGRGGGFQGQGPEVEEVKLFGFVEP